MSPAASTANEATRAFRFGPAGPGPVRIAVIGVGLIAASVHLPLLARSAEYDLRYVSDLDELRAGELARRYGARVSDIPAILSAADVDAVLIATLGNHAQIARAALRAGKHVLAEKPLALTAAEGREVGSLARDVGRVLQVGYMKMHDGLVPVARAAVAAMADIRLVEVSVRHPADHLQTGHLRLTPRAPLSPSAAEVAQIADDYDRERVLEAVGDVPQAWQQLYRTVLCGSVLHEMSLLRAIGIVLPDRFDHADVFPWPGQDGPPSITATASLSPTSRLVLSWNWLPRYPQYEERVRVVCPDGGLRMDLAPPYVLDARSRLEVVRVPRTREGIGESEMSGTEVTRSAAGFDGAFQRQLEAFAKSICRAEGHHGGDAEDDIGGEAGGADARGAVMDIGCLQALFRALAARRGVDVGGEAGRLM